MLETRRLIAYALILLMIAILVGFELKRRANKRNRHRPRWKKGR